MAAKLESVRCGCGYRHAHIQHVCDRGKARSKRQGKFFVTTKDGTADTPPSYCYGPIDDIEKALEFTRKRKSILGNHTGLYILQVVHEEAGT